MSAPLKDLDKEIDNAIDRAVIKIFRKGDMPYTDEVVDNMSIDEEFLDVLKKYVDFKIDDSIYRINQEDYDEEFIKSYKEKISSILEHINANKEKLVKAYIAETGLKPSECKLVTKWSEDGRKVEIYVESKDNGFDWTKY